MKQISEKADLLIGDFQRAAKTFYENDYVSRYELELYAYAQSELETYIAALEAENRALRHSLELRECEEMEHKPDPLDGVPYVSLSNAEIEAMTPDHPLYKLVHGKEGGDGK